MVKFPIYKAIPSLFTVSAFIFGFNGIKLAIDGNIHMAVFYILFASILDLFDGRLARMLSADSKFGAQLDSLSDLVCFGIAGSFIVIFFQDSTSTLLHIGASFYSIGALLRLARFNLNLDQPNYYKGMFIGVPTPAGFALAILPIAFSTAWNIQISTIFYSLYLILIGFLMVSAIPTPSTKSLKIKPSLFPLILGLCALVIICLVFYTWIAISILGSIYILMIFYSILIVYKRKKLTIN